MKRMMMILAAAFCMVAFGYDRLAKESFVETYTTNAVANSDNLWNQSNTKLTTRINEVSAPIAASAAASAVANADTTYAATNALVSLNQSVQYITPSGGSVSIVLPPLVNGRLRDFVVYAYPSADTEVNFAALPHARFADDSVTNAVKANVVTALYFTEVEPQTHIFAVGRANLEKGW